MAARALAAARLLLLSFLYGLDTFKTTRAEFQISRKYFDNFLNHIKADLQMNNDDYEEARRLASNPYLSPLHTARDGRRSMNHPPPPPPLPPSSMPSPTSNIPYKSPNAKYPTTTAPQLKMKLPNWGRRTLDRAQDVIYPARNTTWPWDAPSPNATLPSKLPTPALSYSIPFTPHNFRSKRRRRVKGQFGRSYKSKRNNSENTTTTVATTPSADPPNEMNAPINKIKKMFLDKNMELLKGFMSMKTITTSLTTPSSEEDSDAPKALRLGPETLPQHTTSDPGNPVSIPNPVMLDMAPGKGGPFHSLRLRGRVCHRHVLFPEGPKYDSKGKIYLAGHFQQLGRRVHFEVTKRPRVLLPACCNCCRKSVLGCD